MAHLHFIEDDSGDVVDHLVFCSDYCHYKHMGEKYRGWNGCNEISTTEPCVECGRKVEGLDENRDCECVELEYSPIPSPVCPIHGEEYYEPDEHDESYASEEKALSRAYAIDYST